MVVTGESLGVNPRTGAAWLLPTGHWAGDVLLVPSLQTAASIMEDRAPPQDCWGNIVFSRFPPTQWDKMEGFSFAAEMMQSGGWVGTAAVDSSLRWESRSRGTAYLGAGRVQGNKIWSCKASDREGCYPLDQREAKGGITRTLRKYCSSKRKPTNRCHALSGGVCSSWWLGREQDGRNKDLDLE